MEGAGLLRDQQHDRLIIVYHISPRSDRLSRLRFISHNSSFRPMHQRMPAIFSSFYIYFLFSTPRFATFIGQFVRKLFAFLCLSGVVCLSGLFQNHTAVCREAGIGSHASRIQQYPLVLLCKIDSSWKRPRYHDQILVAVVIPKNKTACGFV